MRKGERAKERKDSEVRPHFLTLWKKGEGTKEEILAETDRIVKEAGRDKLIIGSDCTLPGDIEPWRIRTVIDYAHTL